MTAATEPTMPDPTVPLSDLARLLPALARERVTVRRPSGIVMALLSVDGEWNCRCAGDYGYGVPSIADLSLVCDPPTVRALAVVIAEAVGLDVTLGPSVTFERDSTGVCVCVREHTQARDVMFTTFAAFGKRRHVPALATATDLPSALVAVARSLAGVAP